MVWFLLVDYGCGETTLHFHSFVTNKYYVLKMTIMHYNVVRN